MLSDTPIFAPLVLPPGDYALGLSGGADSTYLARATAGVSAGAGGVRVYFVHINHQLRGEESDADERFCVDLAAELGRPIHVARRQEVESAIPNLPANPSARYRAIRLHVFRQVIDTHSLNGLLLAHHANDQAETVLLRLLRGGGLHAWAGMRARSLVQQIVIWRPLLGLSAESIRSRLREAGCSWREDSSNASSHYRRNQLRQWLSGDPVLVTLLGELAARSQATIEAMDRAAPALATRFPCAALSGLPAVIAEHAARRWLVANGSPSDDVSAEVCARLVEQAVDPASSPRRHYPGKRFVRRRKKHIEPG